jgi:hypothetical protein
VSLVAMVCPVPSLPRLTMMVALFEAGTQLCQTRVPWGVSGPPSLDVRAVGACLPGSCVPCVGIPATAIAHRPLWEIDLVHSFHPCGLCVALSVGGDAGDAAALEAEVLAEIADKDRRNGAEHFRVLSLLGCGNFGYVFKVCASADKLPCVSCCSTCVVSSSAGVLHTPATPEPAQAVRVEARHQLRDHLEDAVDRAAVRPGLSRASTTTTTTSAPPEPVQAADGVHEHRARRHV